MTREIKFRHAFLAVAAAGILFALLIVGYLKLSNFSYNGNQPDKISEAEGQKISDLTTLRRFTSESDFRQYLDKSRELSEFSSQFSLGGMRNGLMERSTETALPMSSPGQTKDSAAGFGSAEPQRISETNVQVAGIDEPDVVKTDGKEIYFSSRFFYGGVVPLPAIDVEGQPANLIPDRKTGVKAVRALPVEDMKIDSRINKEGQLLLRGKTLFVLPETNVFSGSENKIFAYDVSEPSSPKEIWNVEIKDNNQLASARLFGNKIYIVTKNFVQMGRGCMLEPLVVRGKPMPIACNEIFHPVSPVPVDSIYTVTALDASSGEVRDTTSFVGSSSESVVYMSDGSIYITYYFPGDIIRFTADFFKENGDIVPRELVEKIEKVGGYDLSSRAKQVELDEALSRFQNSLSKDERMRIDNELRNRMGNYFSRHKRELEKTGIVKLNADDLSVEASGTVPGKPLNQFSLDEYKDNLRIATTVGSGWWGFGFGGTRDSANDVYVLDKDLRLSGSVTDLGLDEKIYSARFIEDKGYLVTFRQVDPFFVLDLSDPKNPAKRGELKIPGYSSYLHPIAKDRILGVGEENGQVKLSLFDVSDAANPRELSKYNLNEYYSEISQTHHAFLLDKKHEIFFLPGSNGAYVFSYGGDNLRLQKAVSDSASRRAIYINDLLYIIGDEKITVLDERNWDKVKELEL